MLIRIAGTIVLMAMAMVALVLATYPFYWLLFVRPPPLNAIVMLKQTLTAVALFICCYLSLYCYLRLLRWWRPWMSLMSKPRLLTKEVIAICEHGPYACALSGMRIDEIHGPSPYPLPDVLDVGSLIIVYSREEAKAYVYVHVHSMTEGRAIGRAVELRDRVMAFMGGFSHAVPAIGAMIMRAAEFKYMPEEVAKPIPLSPSQSYVAIIERGSGRELRRRYPFKPERAVRISIYTPFGKRKALLMKLRARREYTISEANIIFSSIISLVKLS